MLFSLGFNMKERRIDCGGNAYTCGKLMVLYGSSAAARWEAAVIAMPFLGFPGAVQPSAPSAPAAQPAPPSAGVLLLLCKLLQAGT